jgi:hypothetical protein
MSDSKRVVPAIDDVDFIAKRLAEIEAERAAAIADTELPSEDLSTSYKDTIQLDEFWTKLLEAGVIYPVDPGEIPDGP